jgi:hypothetical protein
MRRIMKPLVFLFILLLCTACAPQGLPTVEPSPTVIATPPTHVTTKPAITSIPTPTATPTPSPIPIFDVVIDNVAIGQQGQLFASGFGNDHQQYGQWDGAKWVVLDPGFQPARNLLAVDRAGHLFVEVLKDSEQGMTTAIMRWDGANWEDITGNFSSVVDTLKPGRISSNIPLAVLAVDGEDNLYAAGAFFYPTDDHTNELPMGFVAKWNQETWTVLGQGFEKVNIFVFAVGSAGEVYAAGEQPFGPDGSSSYVARWDGEKWTPINTSKLYSSQKIAVDESGRLYVSGLSNGPGGFIAYWDGADWITITDQLEGEAPAIYDMRVDANGQLYIGGSFDAVSNVPARNIAYWDGNSWHGLGNGANERVVALTFDPSGYLYAVGFFTEAGGNPAYHVARWDGVTWHALEP